MKVKHLSFFFIFGCTFGCGMDKLFTEKEKWEDANKSYTLEDFEDYPIQDSEENKTEGNKNIWDIISMPCEIYFNYAEEKIIKGEKILSYEGYFLTPKNCNNLFGHPIRDLKMSLETFSDASFGKVNWLKLGDLETNLDKVLKRPNPNFVLDTEKLYEGGIFEAENLAEDLQLEFIFPKDTDESRYPAIAFINLSLKK